MKVMKSLLPRAAMFLLLFTILCGVLYTAAVTLLAQILFPIQANGSLFVADGKQYSALMGQPFSEESHMWGRAQTGLFVIEDARGGPLLYAAPSNASPASEEYAALVRGRVEKIREANPDMAGRPVPVDLVTGSGSGLDPHISLAAAQYQIPRLAKANGITEEDVQTVIDKCTQGKWLGLFGEETVNVLRVNLMLDGIL